MRIIDFLKRFLQRSSRASKEPSLQSPNLSPLEYLPTEILQDITSYLPTASAAVFALCSKTVLHKIGTQYFEELKKGKFQQEPYGNTPPPMSEEQAARQSFLLLLEKDFTDQIFCHSCQIIHDPEKAVGKLLTGPQLRPCTQKYYIMSVIYGYVGFNFPYVYMAMKNHRAGRANQVILNKLSKTVTHYEAEYTYQRTRAPRIIKDRFFLRTQHWLLLPSSNKPLAFPKSFFYCKLCRHLLLYRGKTALAEIVQCRLAHTKESFLFAMCRYKAMQTMLNRVPDRYCGPWG